MDTILVVCSTKFWIEILFLKTHIGDQFCKVGHARTISSPIVLGRGSQSCLAKNHKVLI